MKTWQIKIAIMAARALIRWVEKKRAAKENVRLADIVPDRYFNQHLS